MLEVCSFAGTYVVSVFTLQSLNIVVSLFSLMVLAWLYGHVIFIV